MDIIIKELKLEKAKSVKTPGEEEKNQEGDEEELGPMEATSYRGMSARANYLAQDRMDIQYAVKEISREMAKPTRGGMRKLKRLGRYLVGKPRVVTEYPWQEEGKNIKGYSDSDWGGCKKTGKSTSGGVILKGGHYIRSWSSTQKCVTLSSGEAELVAMVKTSAEVIGVAQLLADWGEEVEGEALVDSSAALGVVKRKGCGKLRHVRVGKLWIQEKEETGELKYNKVRGLANPADMGTKHLNERKIRQYMKDIGQTELEGRAQESLKIA